MTPRQTIALLLLTVVLPSSSLAQERAADRTLAIPNVTVLPMDTERTLPAYPAVITGSRITRRGPADRFAIPAGAERIDGTGKYLMPGLVDTHVRWAGGRMGSRAAGPLKGLPRRCRGSVAAGSRSKNQAESS
jgi:hypothetical protein